MVDVDHYVFRVTFSRHDGEYVGTVAEFPSLSWLEPNQVDALKGITALVAQVVADMEINGEAVPVPMSDRDYSGRFQVRVLPQVHRTLSTRAAEQNVSLNRYVSDLLASG